MMQMKNNNRRYEEYVGLRREIALLKDKVQAASDKEIIIMQLIDENKKLKEKNVKLELEIEKMKQNETK